MGAAIKIETIWKNHFNSQQAIVVEFGPANDRDIRYGTDHTPNQINNHKSVILRRRLAQTGVDRTLLYHMPIVF